MLDCWIIRCADSTRFKVSEEVASEIRQKLKYFDPKSDDPIFESTDIFGGQFLVVLNHVSCLYKTNTKLVEAEREEVWAVEDIERRIDKEHQVEGWQPE